MKKLLSFLIALCLVLWLCPALSVPAGAAEIPTPRVEIDGVIYEAYSWRTDKRDGVEIITRIDNVIVADVASGVTDVTIPRTIDFETESGGETQSWAGVPVRIHLQTPFQGNSTLRRVDLSALTNSASIQSGYFRDCTSLEAVELPPDLERIPDNCFNCCTSLEQIDLPASVTFIGMRAFAGTALSEIQLPRGLKTLGYQCFADTDIAELTIPAGLTELRSVETEGDGIKTITFAGADLSGLKVDPLGWPNDAVFYIQPGATAPDGLKNHLVLTVGQEKPNIGLSLDKASADLGTILAHTRFDLPSVTFTLTNTGDETVSGIRFDWSAHRDPGFGFAFPGNPSGMPGSLEPGQSFRIAVSPMQNLSEGDYTWDMKVDGNGGASASATVKLKVVKAADGLYFKDDPAVLDFGTKNVGDTGASNQIINIINGSDRDITMTVPRSQYYSISVGGRGTTIKAGDYVGLSITPKVGTGTAGDFTEVLHFEPGNPKADLTLKYIINGSGALSVSPTSLPFDDQDLGYSQPAAKTVTITNAGKTAVSLSSPQLSGSDFEIASNPSTSSLAAGRSTTMSVRPKAGLAEGTHTGTLTITGSGGLSASVSLSFTVKNGEYSISADPGSLSFGSIREGETQPAAKTVTVTNSGKQPVTLKAPTASNYILGSLSRTSLSAGQSATFTVRPKADLKKGTYNETLRIGTDKDASAAVSVSFTVKSGNDPTFADVPETIWYFDAVEYVNKNGLMGGKGKGNFDPNGTTTRGELVTILYRLEGSPAVGAGKQFTDVPNGQWYTNAVLWASSNEIVNGVGSGRFAPGALITREQMAAILFRYASYKGYDVSARADLSHYQDLNQVSTYARAPLAWANSEKLVNGSTATTLNPAGRATRAEAAVILHRFCENVAK